MGVVVVLCLWVFVPAQRAAGALRRDRNWDQKPGRELAKLRSLTGRSISPENPKVKYSLKPSFGNPQLHVVLLYCAFRYKTQMTMLQPKGWPSGCRFSVPRYAGVGVVVVLCLWVSRSGATRRRRVAPGSKLGSKAGPGVGEVEIIDRVQYFTRNPKVKYSLIPSFGNPQLHVVLLYCVLRYKTQMTMLQPKGWPSGCRFSVPRYAGMGVVVVLCLWMFRSGATRRRRVAPGSKLGSKAGPGVGEIEIIDRAQYFTRKA